MKKTLLTLMLSFLLISSSFAQLVEISGLITSDLTLTKNFTYKLVGFVRVIPPAVLTINAGTLIVGDNATQGSLIIEPGAKIMAIGTESEPIVFTSEFALAGSGTTPTYGDWGGVILLGNATINVPGGTSQIEGPGDLFGGNDDNDNSGEMHYVRIEYPGIAFSPNNEINGLTFGGVGRGTQIDHIQVSYSGDDSYEWFGGTVNCKYLIAFRGLDDDFDTDFGFRGKLQYLFGLRDPNVADVVSGSNGFESDNDGSGSVNTPRTTPTWWNVTLVGPLETTSTTISPDFKRGMHLRRSSRNRISNAIIMGWPIGILIDGENTVQAAIDDSMWIHNTIVSGWTASTPMDTVSAGGKSFDISTWFTNNSGRTFATNTEVMLTDPFNLTSPNPLPMVGSPALTGYDTPPDDGFFDPSGTFVGAFGSTDWTANWTDFTPGDYVLSVEETELDGIPASFELAQNYPNPFNPSTKIRYSLTNASNVKLTVFNVLGQEVALLVDGLRQAGTYEVNFEATNLPAGIYLYTLKTGSFEVTKKMALIK
jgi:Secretion system C-terminal sorting domain